MQDGKRLKLRKKEIKESVDLFLNIHFWVCFFLKNIHGGSDKIKRLG